MCQVKRTGTGSPCRCRGRPGATCGASHGRRPRAGASPSQLSLPARGLPAAMRGRGGLAELARGLLAAPGPGPPRSLAGAHPQLAVLGRGGHREWQNHHDDNASGKSGPLRALACWCFRVWHSLSEGATGIGSAERGGTRVYDARCCQWLFRRPRALSAIPGESRHVFHARDAAASKRLRVR